MVRLHTPSSFAKFCMVSCPRRHSIFMIVSCRSVLVTKVTSFLFLKIKMASNKNRCLPCSYVKRPRLRIVLCADQKYVHSVKGRWTVKMFLHCGHFNEIICFSSLDKVDLLTVTFVLLSKSRCVQMGQGIFFIITKSFLSVCRKMLKFAELRTRCG